MIKKYLPIIVILLLAFALRSYQLTETPPGLTHDEANHGRDSINILDGELLFYFPLNYGSEPLFNYVVAGGMTLVGENLFSLRLTNVVFGLLAISAVYLWAYWAFGRSTAIVSASLIAISFWPLATSRQALRAGMLPFLATAAVLFFWSILRWGEDKIKAAGLDQNRRIWWAVAGFAISVAATLHTYLAARVLWLLYPVFLAYLAIIHKKLFRTLWRLILAGLLLAGLLIVPMVVYLQYHPEAETRLEMLEGPLQNLRSGNIGPVMGNAAEAIMAFIWPGYGDHFLAYNIPGRPVLGAITAVFFVVGLAACFWRWRRPAYAFVLLWFGIGILPSLITGPEANSTRNLGALPAVYLLPAIGFTTIGQLAVSRWGRPAKIGTAIALALWLVVTGTVTMRDYFNRWSQSPDVRAAYQQTIIQALDYLTEQSKTGPVVISSVYPGAAHDPSIAKVLLPYQDYDLRWVDARYGLLFPAGQTGQLIAPSSTPLHPAFANFVSLNGTKVILADDLDPSFSLYNLSSTEVPDPTLSLNFGDALILLDATWLTGPAHPGEVSELMTVWRVVDPTRVGPIVPPAFESDVIMFTHVLNKSGEILAQRDSLEVPSWDWEKGDLLVQIHPLFIPPETEAGEYEAVVGIYDRLSGERLPLLDAIGAIVDNRAYVVPLNVDE